MSQESSSARARRHQELGRLAFRASQPNPDNPFSAAPSSHDPYQTVMPQFDGDLPNAALILQPDDRPREPGYYIGFHFIPDSTYPMQTEMEQPDRGMLTGYARAQDIVDEYMRRAHAISSKHMVEPRTVPVRQHQELYDNCRELIAASSNDVDALHIDGQDDVDYPEAYRILMRLMADLKSVVRLDRE